MCGVPGGRQERTPTRACHHALPADPSGPVLLPRCSEFEDVGAERANRYDHEVAAAHKKLDVGGGGVPPRMRPSRGLHPEKEESIGTPGGQEVST